MVWNIYSLLCFAFVDATGLTPTKRVSLFFQCDFVHLFQECHDLQYLSEMMYQTMTKKNIAGRQIFSLTWGWSCRLERVKGTIIYKQMKDSGNYIFAR